MNSLFLFLPNDWLPKESHLCTNREVNDMSKKIAVEKLVVDGVTYVPEAVCAPTPTGTRYVIVADRGWVFAGNLTQENGRIRLTDALLIQRWAGIGFDGMIADPCSSKVTIKALKNGVDLPADSELFRVRVSDTWGKK